MKLNRSQIQKKGMEALENNPEGLRWSDLVREVESVSGNTPHNSIRGALHVFLKSNTDKVRKVARGTYQLAKFVDSEAPPETGQPNNEIAASIRSDKLKEEDFYESFADWLTENDEATFAGKLGGSVLGGKWGTPDVLGVLKPRAQDIFKFTPQIISAEIKIAPGETVVAFGQAIAYRLFSHKSYIVVPDKISSDDLNRLKSLCTLHGVGLVTFALDKRQPNYSVIVIPEIAEPDMFYVNSMLDRLNTSDNTLLNNLF